MKINCLLTSKQVVVIIRVNPVGFGRCVGTGLLLFLLIILLTEEIWRLRLRNSSTHSSHRVTLQTGRRRRKRRRDR